MTRGSPGKLESAALPVLPTSVSGNASARCGGRAGVTGADGGEGGEKRGVVKTRIGRRVDGVAYFGRFVATLRGRSGKGEEEGWREGVSRGRQAGGSRVTDAHVVVTVCLPACDTAPGIHSPSAAKAIRNPSFDASADLLRHRIDRRTCRQAGGRTSADACCAWPTELHAFVFPVDGIKKAQGRVRETICRQRKEKEEHHNKKKEEKGDECQRSTTASPGDPRCQHCERGESPPLRMRREERAVRWLHSTHTRHQRKRRRRGAVLPGGRVPHPLFHVCTRTPSLTRATPFPFSNPSEAQSGRRREGEEGETEVAARIEAEKEKRAAQTTSSAIEKAATDTARRKKGGSITSKQRGKKNQQQERISVFFGLLFQYIAHQLKVVIVDEVEKAAPPPALRGVRGIPAPQRLV